MLLIFDCDGTLVNSEHLNNAALSQVLIDQGYNEYTPQRCLELFTGFSLEDCLTLVRKREAGAFFLDSEMIRRYIGITLDKLKTDLRVDPMAVPTLQMFQERGFDMVVASNGETDIVRETIRVAGMSPFFPQSHIFTKNMVANPKPAADLFKLALHRTKTDPRYAVVIEDSVTGVMAAKAAGLRVIGITSFAENQEQTAIKLKRAGANAIIHNIAELADFAGITRLHEQELQTGFSNNS
jgi:beta-phosphoglucomutase-like phosphatase (HAD superfamily)